jgi:cysteine desulfurase
MLHFWKKSKKQKRIYFDSASAVPVLEVAKKSFLETLEMSFANASSIHTEGEKAKEILHEARKKVARFLHTKPHTVHFAASTTEANNIFIKGAVLKENTKPVHIIYSKSDHSAIVDVVESCKLFGAESTSITPNKIGVLQPEEIVKNINENTRLICFSYVSSELGTIQPVKKIVQAVHDYCQEKNFAKENWPKIFVDATQAVKYESVDVMNLGVDGLSLGSAKLGGVSGAAALYVKNGVQIVPIISGGGQEEGVRSGTENLPAIVAMAEVVSLGTSQKEYVYSLRNFAIEKLRENFQENELEIFGDTKFKYNKFFEHAAPHILLISLVDMLGEETLLRLDAKGISVSTASACSLLENSGSNFLKSIGEPVKAKETIRISFSESNTKEEIEYFVKTLVDIKSKFI